MDIVQLNQTGGFPLTTNILNEMQKAYSIFNSLGFIAGNFSIISGCEVVGSNVSEGVVFINGELYPLKSGTLNAKVKIIEDSESKDFEDGANKEVVFKYHVEFGSAVENCFEWSKFKRIKTNQELEVSLDERIKKVERLIKKTLPIGLVAVWGKYDPIPEGWEPYEYLEGYIPIGETVNKELDYYFVRQDGNGAIYKQLEYTDESTPSETDLNIKPVLYIIFKGFN